jgi:hypothetical protein
MKIILKMVFHMLSVKVQKMSKVPLDHGGRSGWGPGVGCSGWEHGRTKIACYVDEEVEGLGLEGYAGA